MAETQRLQLFDPQPALLQIGLALRQLELAAGDKTAVVAQGIFQLMPQIARGQGQGNFRNVSAQGAYATGIDAGGMAPAILRFQHGHLDPRLRQVQRGAQAMDATADHQHVGLALARLTHRPVPPG
ncbi:hypothetical protein D3C87_1707700 [compost metagenome]